VIGWSEGELMKNTVSVCALALAFAMGTGLAQSSNGDHNRADRSAGQSSRGQDRITREVRHELVMLPYYGVFDNLLYRVDGGTVTLMGQVTRPTLKSDAERAVKDVEGVTRVENQIQVLPLSPMDDGIRVAEYRAIFGKPGLDRYAMQAVPPIHIIVSNGNVTLEGVLSSEADKNQAGIYAKGVSGVFGVTNNLRVEK
jgi:hyperosmotically inducible protein